MRKENYIKATKPLVSIIIPVFNSEAYVERCLNSLVAQSYANCEIIIIDDGSEDGSLDIIRRYQDQAINPLIKIIEQPNSGVSVARNAGVQTSTGKYITFVDADDWLQEDAIESMVRIIELYDVDCVRTRASVVKGKSTGPMHQQVAEGLYSGAEIQALMYASATSDLLCYAWLLLIKRDILVEHNLTFPTNITMMEDTWFYVALLNRIESMYISDKVTYNYVINTNGASRSLQGFKGKIESIERVNEYIENGALFSESQMRHINAVHCGIIASMLMVRLDRLPFGQILPMLRIVADRSGVHRIYNHADMRKLGIYNGLAAWASIRGVFPVVVIIRLLRSARVK